MARALWGRYLNEKGVLRLKIVDFLRRVYSREHGTSDFGEWTFTAEEERPGWYIARFIEELHDYLRAHTVRYASLESLYGPRMAHGLADYFEDRFVLLYIDAPYTLRLDRQVQREQLKSIDKARVYLDRRDKVKEEKGVPALMKFQGHLELVDNSRSLGHLFQQIDAILERRGVTVAPP